MYNNNEEPDIFASESNPDVELLEQAQINLKLSEEDFLERFKITIDEYTALLSAWQAIKHVATKLDEMSSLNIDSEVKDNTEYLIEDYTFLLTQIHMTHYWEQQQQ